MHVQSNGGWLGGWLGGRLGGWLAGRPKPPPPPPRWLAQLRENGLGVSPDMVYAWFSWSAASCEHVACKRVTVHIVHPGVVRRHVVLGVAVQGHAPS